MIRPLILRDFTTKFLSVNIFLRTWFAKTLQLTYLVEYFPSLHNLGNHRVPSVERDFSLMLHSYDCAIFLLNLTLPALILFISWKNLTLVLSSIRLTSFAKCSMLCTSLFLTTFPSITTSQSSPSSTSSQSASSAAYWSLANCSFALCTFSSIICSCSRRFLRTLIQCSTSSTTSGFSMFNFSNICSLSIGLHNSLHSMSRTYCMILMVSLVFYCILVTLPSPSSCLVLN